MSNKLVYIDSKSPFKNFFCQRIDNKIGHTTYLKKNRNQTHINGPTHKNLFQENFSSYIVSIKWSTRTRNSSFGTSWDRGPKKLTWFSQVKISIVRNSLVILKMLKIKKINKLLSFIYIAFS